jgi:hypothetical protein
MLFSISAALFSLADVEKPTPIPKSLIFLLPTFDVKVVQTKKGKIKKYIVKKVWKNSL